MVPRVPGQRARSLLAAALVSAFALGPSCGPSATGGARDAGPPGEADGARDAGGDGPDGTGPGEDAAPARDYDVVVVGGGLGGVAVALQAGRMGARVALLEESGWLGGQATAAGVSSMDESVAEEWRYGLYGELISRIAARYTAGGHAINTCYWSLTSHCFEPRVGREVLHEMIDDAVREDGGDAAIDVYLHARVTAVTRAGARVTGVVTNAGVFGARIVVDATEAGDLLPLAGARYRVGNGTSDAPEPDACIQDITYTAIIRKYPAAAPQLPIAPPGYAVESPFFARIVARGGSSGGFPIAYPVSFAFHNAYRGVPDSDGGSYTVAQPAQITRTGVNYANDYPRRAAYSPDPADPLVTLSARYLEDRAYRRQVDCEAKLRTLQFLYYVQSDAGLAEPLWSFADEGYGDDAQDVAASACPGLPAELRALERLMPILPYVRESRRVIGLATLTARDRHRALHDSLAVGGYPNDLHNCTAAGDFETLPDPQGGLYLEGVGDPSHGDDGIRLFQIPWRAFIPADLDGLLVAEKNLSLSRLASGACRLQPTVMMTGQAVGVLAALALVDGGDPRTVAPIRVQDELVRLGVGVSRLRFCDVPRGDPAWGDVEIAATHEIMVGQAGACPGAPALRVFGRDAALSRAEAAAVIARLAGLTPVSPAAPSFQDVPASHWAYPFVEAVLAAGITGGCSTSPPLYCPDAALSRVQLATFLVRGLGLDPSAAPATAFYDDVPPGHWGFSFVQAATEAGLMGACAAGPRRFCPDDTVPRAAAAASARRGLLLRPPMP